MTNYPTLGEIEGAVRHLKKFVWSAALKQGEPEVHDGRLFKHAGGRALVFRIDMPEGKVALRCWQFDPGAIGERYRALVAFQQEHALPYFADAVFEQQGLLVRGATIPVCHMPWLRGDPLSSYIDKHVADAETMATLAKLFLDMATHLHSQGVSHGDLQDGNILVVESVGTAVLKLIDYDCIYVPSLAGSPNLARLEGLDAYQHPRRNPMSSTAADYFSEYVIYLSLRAYAEKPELWMTGQENRLLFEAVDWLDPEKSRAFHRLQSLIDEMRARASALSTDSPGQNRLNLSAKIIAGIGLRLKENCARKPEQLEPLEMAIRAVIASPPVDIFPPKIIIDDIDLPSEIFFEIEKLAQSKYTPAELKILRLPKESGSIEITPKTGHRFFVFFESNWIEFETHKLENGSWRAFLGGGFFGLIPCAGLLLSPLGDVLRDRLESRALPLLPESSSISAFAMAWIILAVLSILVTLAAGLVVRHFAKKLATRKKDRDPRNDAFIKGFQLRVKRKNYALIKETVQRGTMQDERCWQERWEKPE